MIVDFEGRVLTKASEGHGEKIVVGPIDISALRHEREIRKGHHLLAHLRTEAYPAYQKHIYPPRVLSKGETLSYDGNNELIDAAKNRLTDEKKQ